MPSQGASRFPTLVRVLGPALVLAGLFTGPRGLSKHLLADCNSNPSLTKNALGLATGFAPFDGLVCTTLGMFHDILSTTTGIGVALSFLSVQLPQLPLLTHLLVYGGQHKRWLSFGISVVSLGQLVTIGISTTALWVPYYWAGPDSFATLGKRVGSPKRFTFLFILLSQAVCLGSSAINTAHPAWPWANVAFQLYPIVFLPLLWAKNEPETSSTSSLTIMQKVAQISLVQWWVGLSQTFLDLTPSVPAGTPGAVRFYSSAPLINPTFAALLTSPFGARLRLRPTALTTEFSDGAYFLLFNCSALLLSLVTVVVVHERRRKERKGTKLKYQGSEPSVWTTIAKDVFLGGPGYALARYLVEEENDFKKLGSKKK